ncbi:MAG TPA: DUF6427 family protein [Bacteroidales bacterium]|nr:DUF6427 family protein [Bacteroidales bacterium]
MVLRYFNGNRISVLIVIVLLPVAYWIPSLFTATSPATPYVSEAPLGELLLSFNIRYRLLSSLAALLIVLLNGYLLVQLNTIYIFIPGRTQLPALFYFILVTGFYQLHQLNPALVASSLIIILFYRLLNTYKDEATSYNFMDAGILVSLAALFYFPALALLLLIPISLVNLRPFNWREWAYSILGLLLPFIFLFSIYYLADIPVSDYFNKLAGSFEQGKQVFRTGVIINWTYVFLNLVISSYFMISLIGNIKIHARKFFILFFWFFLVSVLIYLVIPGTGNEMVYFLSVPLAFLFGHYFLKCKRNWINDLLFLLFLVLLVLQRII